MRLDGKTYKEIAAEAGVSRQRIQKMLSPPPSIRCFVVKKFGGKCNRCGIFVGQSGHVHHNGDNPETYNDIENLELLCIGCHRTAHTDSGYLSTTYSYGTQTVDTRRSSFSKCEQCGYRWLPRQLSLPARCPKCQSRHWAKVRL